jgi:hypothetical protein
VEVGASGLTLASRAALLLLLGIVGMALLTSTAEVFPIQPGSPLYNYTEQSQSVQHGSIVYQGNDGGALMGHRGYL